MDKPLERHEGIEHPPSLFRQLLTILIFTGGIALLAIAMTCGMAYLFSL